MGESKSEQLLSEADSLYAIQQYQQALSRAHEALPLSKGSDVEADVLNLLAVINIRLSDYEEAAKYAKQCYALDEKTGDPDVMSSSLNTLAAIYMGANQPKEAEKYVLKGIEQAEKANNPSRMAVLQAMASEVYHAQGDDQKALPYIERAYEIDKQSGNEPRAMVRLAQKASVLIGLHNYQEAEKTLKEVIPFLRKTPDRQSLGIALNKLGMALLSQKREQEAVPYYQEAVDIFQQLGDPYNEVHARRGLYESLWKQNPDEAKLQLDRFNDLKDSIYNNVSADKLAKYNAEFGNDWLRIENHEQRQAKWWAILAAVIAVILAIAVWLYMRYRHQKQIRINAELSERIKELREKYDILNEQYDNALATGNNDDGEELDASDNEFLSKTINVINELILTGQIDANHVAERLGLSLFQFRQRLVALTDETPQSFIQTIRMRRARHLLDKHPEMNISEVAMLCAYNDTPNFTRAFKRTFGMTPTQYLEKQQ
jgi:AraC-like DNA-binding protein